MKVLVTGGGGFIGGAICRQLHGRGNEVISFQRSAHPELEAAGVAVARGDLGAADDQAALHEAVSGCDAVIHTAGKAGAWGSREAYYAANVTGTENVIAACRDAGVARLVFTSSPSVVHGGGDIEGGDESLPYPEHFTTPYPETKAIAERMVMAADGTDADGVTLHTVSLRPHLVWGAGDKQLLPRLTERAARGPIKLPGANKLIDTVYIDNAARAHLLALEALDRNPDCHGRTYFISNGEPRPQGEIMAALLAAAGVNAEFRPIPPALAHAAGALCEWTWKALRRDDEPPVTRWAAEQLTTAHWYDITAARRDLGYEPGVSIDEGLRRLAASLR